MPVDIHDLVDSFGEAALIGNGALFIGAGLSAAAGLPDWEKLLEPLRVAANVPLISDFPLMAEYISRSNNVGETALQAHVLETLCEADDGDIAEVHRLLGRLPVGEIWTTNFDQLLERACPGASVVVNDEDVRSISSVRQTIIKMHGSLDAGPPPSWDYPPVLTRTRFETYEDMRPRTWALLRASYLSRTMLFMGFSFTDPNVELLLRLARRYRTSVSDRHLAVMKRPDPTDADSLRLHRLRVADLEDSGVRVCEIEAFTDLEPLLVALVRRTRPAQIFISGSAAGQSQDDIVPWCRAIAARVAGDGKWRLVSLGGDAGWLTTREVARIRRAEQTYDPSQLAFFFRAKNEPAPILQERIGTAVYTDFEREQLVPSLLDDCRALLAIRGGARSMEEIEWAQAAGVGVVPLASSGGAAHQYWERHRSNPPALGGRAVEQETWLRLDHENHDVSARAAHDLLKQAMYAL